VARKAKAPKTKPPLRLARPGDRFEVSFDGAMLNLGQAPGAGMAPDYSQLNCRSLESVTAFAKQGLFMPIVFDTDNGCIARFLLGAANEQEAAEWVGRVVWKLDLRSGKMFCENLAIDVPPGDYLVEVCLYLPHDSASYIIGLVQKDSEYRWDYWMRTRPGLKLPGWLLEAVTSQDEDVVPEELLPESNEPDRFADFRVFVNGKWRPPPRSCSDRYADVLIRLAPLPAKLKMPTIAQDGFCWNARTNAQKKLSKAYLRSLKDSICYFLWEGRKPALCPFGIPCVNLIDPDRPV
jgi:hypothetical protein